MPFNPTDYIKPLDNSLANDREIYGDQTDMKINDLRKDVIAALSALAGGGGSPAPASVTINTISPIPTAINPPSNTINSVPPVSTATGVFRMLTLPNVNQSMAFTVNANWNGTTWTADNTGETASFFGVQQNGRTYQRFKSDTSVPWTTWDKIVVNTPEGETFVEGPITAFGGFGIIGDPLLNIGPLMEGPITFTKTLIGSTPAFISTLVVQNFNVDAGSIVTEPISNYGGG